MLIGTPLRITLNIHMDIDLQEEYREIGAFYDTVKPLLDWPDEALFCVAGAVSAWSPAKHLFHILRANGMMLKGIHLICEGHRTTAIEGAPNEAGRSVLAHGFVRGRGQAPDAVVPPDDVSREVLQDSWARGRKKYVETEAYLPAIPDATGRIRHSFLGWLNAAEWLRLARLHSEHHLAIIRDIVGHEETA